MSLVFWTISAVICGLFIYWTRAQLRKQSTYWASRDFPEIDVDTLLGNLFVRLFRRKPLREIDRILYDEVKHKLCAPYAGFAQFGQRQLIVTDLEFAKRIFIKDADSFLARMPTTALKDMDPLLGSMLLFMEGDEWKELRSKMSPTFTTGKIKRMFGVFEGSSEKLVKYLSNKASAGEVEVQSVFGRYTMDVIASAAFGLDARTFEEEDPLFLRMGRKFQIEPNFKMIASFILLFAAPKLASALQIRLVDKEMGDFFTKVIVEAIKQREAQDGVRHRRDDFLQLMLDARNGRLKDDEDVTMDKTDGVDLSDHVLVAQSILFILAGYDTTLSLLVFAAYELALNPEIQSKLRSELEKSSTRDGNGSGFSYESLAECEYLDQVVNETLRMYPPITRTSRRALVDYQIPDSSLVIPKGTQILIPTFCIQRDADHFPNPDTFDPERFTKEGRASRSPIAFQAFGHGPRNCIGARFALTNAKLALANLVLNFDFQATGRTLIPMEFENAQFLKPKGGELHLKVTKRENEIVR